MRELATIVGITERAVQRIVDDLSVSGYLSITKEGRRNRYHIQTHLPLPEPDGRERTIGEMLDLLTGTETDPRSIRANSALPAPIPEQILYEKS